MHKYPLLWRLVFLASLFCLLIGGLSCAVQSPGIPRVWFDVPRDGAEVSEDTTVKVTSHAYAREGVAEIMLSVNGEPYKREPPLEPGGSFTQITQEWLPEGPGEYVLEVRAYDTKGEVSNAAMVTVRVAEEVTLVTPEVPTPVVTEEPTIVPTVPTEVPTLIPTPTFTFTPTPTFTPTFTPTPTITPTSIPPAQVNFWVEGDSITSGECTVLHWDVEYATAVYLDGEGVGGHDTRQVCPASTTTYHLHVTAPGGDVDRYVTVNVAAPPDTTPPSITKITASASTIYNYSTCGPTSVTIMAWANDPSGISKVELNYRVVRGSDQGQWRTLGMGPAGGDKYQATLGFNELKASLDPPVYSTATIEYYIKAWDGRGNMTQSGTQTVTLKACLI